jgi:hypothetical protein
MFVDHCSGDMASGRLDGADRRAHRSRGGAVRVGNQEGHGGQRRQTRGVAGGCYRGRVDEDHVVAALQLVEHRRQPPAGDQSTGIGNHGPRGEHVESSMRHHRAQRVRPVSFEYPGESVLGVRCESS